MSGSAINFYNSRPEPVTPRQWARAEALKAVLSTGNVGIGVRGKSSRQVLYRVTQELADWILEEES